jgi:cytochrome b561
MMKNIDGIMQDRPASYGLVAKLLHWAVVLLLIAGYVIGWLMPDIRRGMSPGTPMNLHMSIGLVVLILIVGRLLWRFTHSVDVDPGLPRWQHLSSVAVHWALYALALITPLTGWSYASARGWPVTLFSLVQLPPLFAANSPTARAIGEIHESIVWLLLAVIAVHVGAALIHAFVYRDQVMQRMLFRR